MQQLLSKINVQQEIWLQFILVRLFLYTNGCSLNGPFLFCHPEIYKHSLNSDFEKFENLECLLQKLCRPIVWSTVKILKFGTPQTIAIIVLKIEKFDVTLH